jgi:flagellar motor switch protein FliG
MDADISEYLHALTSLRLAAAFNSSPEYVKKVAKRISKKLKNKKNAKICKNLSRQRLPIKAVNLFTDQISQAYAQQGYDWKEQA